ncbi:hypothetical protein AB0M05_17275 [Streptomyces violaceusniger]|uniref:hypothetical protein n=1 Tax=Streptomyces violaceusniger TaxID=68280 RepID=UPI003428352E
MSTQPRLLPWPGPAGKPCYLVSDADGEGYLSRLADEMEAVQLQMGAELIGHARLLLRDRKAGVRELRYLALCYALGDEPAPQDAPECRKPVRYPGGRQRY